MLIRELMNNNISELQSAMPLEHPKLSKPPKNIEDKFSSVLGDGFHYMHRITVPTNHCYKKRFFVSLQEAIFAWNPEMLKKVKDKKKRTRNLTDIEIESDMCFNVRWWQERVFRTILPPSFLYWRVRAVLAVYGTKLDTDSKKHLFNERAWKKANNLLE